MRKLFDCLLMFMDCGLGHHCKLDFFSISPCLDIYHLSDHFTEVVTLFENYLEALI